MNEIFLTITKNGKSLIILNDLDNSFGRDRHYSVYNVNDSICSEVVRRYDGRTVGGHHTFWIIININANQIICWTQSLNEFFVVKIISSEKT